MSRGVRLSLVSWALAAAFFCGQSLVGCEALVGVGSLSERSPDAGSDSSTGSGSASGSGSADDVGDASGSASGSSSGSSSGSGSSSAGAADDGPDDAPSPPDTGSVAQTGACATDAGGCNGPQPEECIGGVWADVDTACSGSTPACLAGACVSCTPTTSRCDAQQPQKCDGTGTWQDVTACDPSQTCVSGACGGVCGPGQKTCIGSTPQTCDPTGQWLAGSSCTGSASFCVDGTCTTPPPSCQSAGAGRTNCGASSESCCMSAEVPGGTFDRTYTNTGSGPTAEADPATVSGLRLDKYLVTVGRFRQFVAAWNNGSGYLPAAGTGKHTHLNGGQGVVNGGASSTYETGWVASDDSNVAPTNANLACDSDYATWTTVSGNQENLPANCVNWWEAYAFCIWDGGFLPTQAEWEFTAAAGSQQRAYPWGSTAPGTACPGTGCDYAIYNCDYPSGSGTCAQAQVVSNIAPVGTATLGAGLWGQLDLSGDVTEWTLDWYAAYPDPCTDCANLTATSNRVLVGGNFYLTALILPPPFRNYKTPATRFSNVGFRCARTP